MHSCSVPRVCRSALARAAVAKSVLDMFRTLDDLLPLFIPLNRREIKVLDFVAVERINKKSGTALDIVERTVKMHVVSILRKMGVNERMHAVVAAIRHGWVTVKE